MNTPLQGLKTIREVYFIGIGGIGMSAVARYFHAHGVKVSGYDKTPTALTRELEAAGMPVHYEERTDLAPAKPDLVVYTPAIPEQHLELAWYRENGQKVVKRSDVLQIISAGSFNLCVAGTHGKTTISTMLAHLLRDTGFGCNAFLGGISVNYGTNFWSDPKNVCVIEADEYDRSFLKLSPDVAIVTAMDADHLDIYGTAEDVEQAFIDFSKKVKPGGLLIKHFGLHRGKELVADHTMTYSLQNDNADICAENLKMVNGGYVFDVKLPYTTIEQVELNMGGMHNVENALAAIAAASSLKIDSDKIRQAVKSFRGVKRRFEYHVRTQNIVYIDDYAHHPEELRALLKGARALFNDKKCTILFQPHLFSRTKDFAAGFAAALDLADEVILLPVYGARELPVEGVTSQLIASKMDRAEVRLMDRDQFLRWMDDEYVKHAGREYGSLFITAGAGDIDTLVPVIKKKLEEVNL
ncbi:MAG: UDP-N-acetylmuramate--L-alanine ligase [Chitinophagaceae bacterium]|nr:MAG: UDP-N-acetylmuramate--L-alanine ligase [Chitinophagaceae bacterium]